MKKYVFDSYALLAYCEKEQGYAKVIDILSESLIGKSELFVSVINWGEMYYIALREGGKERAEFYKSTIENYPINIINADKEQTIIATKIKAHNKMSYADAFAAALAEIKRAILVTGDNEFKQLESKIRIEWI